MLLLFLSDKEIACVVVLVLMLYLFIYFPFDDCKSIQSLTDGNILQLSFIGALQNPPEKMTEQWGSLGKGWMQDGMSGSSSETTQWNPAEFELLSAGT